MLKKYFIKKRIEKNIKRLRSIELPFKTGVILTVPEIDLKKDFVKKVARLTGIPYENWDVLHISQHDTHPDFISILNNHFNWRGKLIEPNIRKFFDKQYDLLLDFSALKTEEEQLISSGIKARFKVGTQADRMDFYDMVIEERRNLQVFLIELEKYFKALGYIETEKVS